MLQSIRDHTQGWIAGVIISLLILSFALWGIHSYIDSSGASNVVAKVNGTDITKSQLAVAYERIRRQMQMQFSSNYQLPERAEANLKQRALQSLINTQVLKQASLSEGYRITSGQIDNYLQSIPAFQVNGEFSLARFQQMLNSNLFTPADFLDLINTSLLIDQPKLGIIFSSFSLPNEVANITALIGQERNIQYTVLPLSFFANQPVSISNEDVQKYYVQHQEEFKTPEQVSVEYISLSVKDLVKNINPSDETLKNFYNENSNTFVDPAQWKLEIITLPLATDQTKIQELMKEANSGKDFAGLSQKYSATLNSDLKKGATLNQIPFELQKTVTALTKVGEVSKPIKTSNGVALVKVVGYQEGKVQTYETVKDKVREAYVRQQAEEKYADVREKLANLTYEHPESLNSAATELGLAIKSTTPFTKDKGDKNDLSINNKVREAAYSNDVLNLKNNSDVIQINPEEAVVVRVKSHVPAALLPVAAVQNQISAKLNAQAIEAKARVLSDEIKQKLQLGAITPADLNSQYKISWNNLGFTGRHAAKIDPSILDVAFEMPAPKDNKNTFAIAKVADGYAIIMLTGVKNGTVDPGSQSYQAFADQIQNSQGMLEYQLYQNSLMDHAKIVSE